MTLKTVDVTCPSASLNHSNLAAGALGGQEGQFRRSINWLNVDLAIIGLALEIEPQSRQSVSEPLRRRLSLQDKGRPDRPRHILIDFQEDGFAGCVEDAKTPRPRTLDRASGAQNEAVCDFLLSIIEDAVL